MEIFTFNIYARREILLQKNWLRTFQIFFLKLHQDTTKFCTSHEECTGRADTCTAGHCVCGTTAECRLTEACSAGTCTGKQLLTFDAWDLWFLKSILLTDS